MSKIDDEQILSLWRLQPTQVVVVSPEQLRQRALQFETSARKRNRTDLVSFVLVCALSLGGAFWIQGNTLVRAGALLLALWAGIGIYSVRRFHRLAAQPSESLAGACVTWYRQQLEQQRDVATSRPWGIALALPGLALMLSGYLANNAPWPAVAILGAVTIFVGVAVIIHGKVLAGQWQREINELDRIELRNVSAEHR